MEDFFFHPTTARYGQTGSLVTPGYSSNDNDTRHGLSNASPSAFSITPTKPTQAEKMLELKKRWGLGQIEL